MGKIIQSLMVLVSSAVVVHLSYLSYIRPQAESILSAARKAGETAPRDLVVILKDVEQEICLILLLWGGFLIISKCVEILKDRHLFDVDILEVAAKEESPEGKALDLRKFMKSLDELSPKIANTPLIKALSSSIRRYLITENVQNTSDAIESSVDALAMRMEAEGSMIRYLIWAIPSIGFIGTVRGIGEALAQADKALIGDISAMTNSLGVAFNSTLVALLISIVLMFLLHQLQRLQDSLVVDTQQYCESFFLNRISKIDDE
jgi:biopolymer transport protein ExbB/TolQ